MDSLIPPSGDTLQRFSLPASILHYRIVGSLIQRNERVTCIAQSNAAENQVHITLFPALQPENPAPASELSNLLRMRSSELARFRHAGMLGLLDAGAHEQIPFVVHEYSQGLSLSTKVREEGRIPAKIFIPMLAQIASAIDTAHAKGLYHGSLRSEVAIIDAQGLIRISDLGAEYIVQPLRSAAVDMTPAIEELAYQPLERLHGPRLDRKGDLYSVAVIAFEGLTGKLPFAGGSSAELRAAILSGKPKRASELITTPPAGLDQIFERALSSKPTQRFESAQEFVAALAKVFAAELEGVSLGHGSGTRKSEAVTRIIEPPPKVVAPKSSESKRPSPKTVSPVEPKPGSAFAESDEGVEGRIPVLGRHSNSDRQRRILLLAGGLLTLLALLFVFTTTAPQGSAPPNSEIPTPRDPVSEQMETDILEPPRVMAFPAGVPVDLLKDRELLGLLWDNSSEESVILQALKEATIRRVAELPNALTRTLTNASVQVRIAGMRAAAETRDRRLVPFIVVLLDDVEPRSRQEAARAIAAMGDRKAVPFLARRYQSEDRSDVRLEIKSAIDRISGYPVPDSEIDSLQ